MDCEIRSEDAFVIAGSEPFGPHTFNVIGESLICGEGPEVCFAKRLIENASLDAALEPELNGFL